MAVTTQRGERRPDALSKERIVDAAIEILDAEGEAALTFRALAARLSTGSGAIYWHVANKRELLAAATDAVVARAVAEPAGQREPRGAIRAAALGVFDAIDAHPWIGAQLSNEPWQFAVLQILERFGRPLQALGVPEPAQFDSATALLGYVLGLAGQYAAGARLGPDRDTFLARTAARWTEIDSGRYPFLHQVAPQLRAHDDRAQFLAGVDIFLAGMTSLR